VYVYTSQGVDRQNGQTQEFVGKCDEWGRPGESTRPESFSSFYSFSWVAADDGSLTAAQP
jgi:hypothetical protein